MRDGAGVVCLCDCCGVVISCGLGLESFTSSSLNGAEVEDEFPVVKHELVPSWKKHQGTPEVEDSLQQQPLRAQPGPIWLV